MMPAQSAKHALFQHLKLSGYLQLVVSVGTSSPSLVSGSLVSSPPTGALHTPLPCNSQSGSTGWDKPQQNGSRCDGGLSEGSFCCPDQGASANEVSDKQSLVGKEANGSNMDPQQSGSFQSDIFEQLEGDTQTICSRCPDFIRYSSLSSDGFTQEGTSDSYQPHDKPSKIIPCLDSHGLMALENAEMLIGAECWLTREGGSVELHTDRGFVLRSIASQSCQDTRENIMQVRFRADTLDLTFADSLQGFFGTVSSSMSMEFGEPCGASVYDDEVCGNEHLKASPCAGRSDVGENCSRNQLEINVRVESTPAAECPQGSDYMNFLYQNKKGSVGKKRKPAGRANGTSDILHQIQLLCVRNFVRVQGHVVRVSRKAADVRAVVLLDLYLPSSLWAGRNYWKPGPAVAAVLNHISCDWEDRRRTLGGVCNCQKLENVECEGMWTLGACQVLGCKMHFEASEATKRTRFDLHALFKALPSISRDQKGYSTAISPQHGQKAWQSGIWDIPDEILTSAFSRLLPRDLQSVAATCRHTRELAVSIMPCMNLKLFPHQQAAVSWMLHRELNPQTLVHPLFRDLQTEDGFHFYLNCVSGDLSPEVPPSVMDFRGGLFCDEPGLGKTVTALSLILKTQGTLSEPPSGAEVQWCEHRSGDRYGYYEISLQQSTSVLKRCMDLKAMRNRADVSSPLSRSLSHGTPKTCGSLPMSTGGRKKSRSSETASSNRTTRRRLLESGQAARTPNSVKRKLLEAYEGLLADGSTVEQMESFSDGRQKKSAVMINNSSVDAPHTKFINSNSSKVDMPDYYEDADVWVECDSCSKWRKLPDGSKPPEEGLAWFCNMNKDPLHQSCSDPEENWDDRASIKYLPGFYKVGSSSGQEQNITHFANVLKENGPRRDLETTAALTWLANLTPEKLTKLASIGLAVPPGLRLMPFFGDDQHAYDKIFQRFGLVQRREGRGVTKWCYPRGLDTGLVFDLPALREALTRPLDVVRLYLSRATLIVVPPNLVEHWKNQILRHTKPGQLRVYVWNEQKRPPQAQDLAWNFDVVITTFPRLSSEWSSRESSVLMSVHWLRIMLDEGHTLGSSLSLTNKLQMAVSMHASRRWLLTGTPTPNTPNSQVAHLQPMLRFLHEEVYGEHQKSWEGGILKPFEAGLEEGRANLLQVLRRCMISARKSDLCTIPPCVRKVQLLDFTQKHAESYNELVVTVRRNILMADWNDPSHVESLLNPKQWKFRSNTIRNVRLSCCVAGHIKVRNAGEDIQETMEILAQQGMDSMSIEFAIIRTALLYGGNCNRCQEWCRLPIVTPCRHLLCLDCVALDRERCTLPDCGNPYKMQSPEDLTRPENPNPKWPVPQDLIELQPSYVQDNWDPDWQGTSSSKVAYLVERLKTLQGANGDQNLCLEKEDDGEKSPERCFSNPSCGGIDQHEKSQNQQKGSPEKAIVFSQFLEHIHVIERQLTEAGIKVAGMYSPMHSSNKMKSLLSFQNDSDCTVLLMDGSAALGLDLSFVTHVFLMEPIWDRSMEEQVVSRAHRMGATRPVLVETLAMRGTIEEQMLEFLQDPVEHSRALKQEALNIPEYGRSSQRTVHDFAESSYLARLSFVRTSGG